MGVNSYENYNNSSGTYDINYVQVYRQAVLPPLYSLVFIVGILGNGLVMCVLAKNLQKSNMMDTCLLNLALSDMLFLITLPFWAHYSAVPNWTFGDSMCRAVTALHNLGFYGSIFFMLLMTLDRYVVTVHAHSPVYFKRSSGRVGVALIMLMWAFSVGASLPDIIYSKVVNETSKYKCDTCFPEKTWKLAGYIQMNVLGLLLPLFIMGFSYSQIIPTVRAMKSRKRFRAIKLMLVLIMIFLFCWTPYNVVTFLNILLHLEYLDGLTWKGDLDMAMLWVETIAYSHCCLNPFIYAIMGERFRRLSIKTLKKCFPLCFKRCSLITSEPSVKRKSLRGSVMYSTSVV